MVLPSPHARFVHRDLDQPGAEARLAAKLPQVGKGLQNRLLRHVLGVRVVAQEGQRRRIDPAFVGLTSSAKRAGSPLADAVGSAPARSSRRLGFSGELGYSSQHLDFNNRLCREDASAQDSRDSFSIPSTSTRNCSSRGERP